jgi:anionic cell wall polymer biosynthesis LytR-Cps2A-Psr (LCP) family protein
MTKFLKWLFIVLAVIVIIAAVALFVFVQKFDINTYKTKIVSSISKNIDHPVEIGKIQMDFSLDQGLNLAIYQFGIMEKPPSQGLYYQ